MFEEVVMDRFVSYDLDGACVTIDEAHTEALEAMNKVFDASTDRLLHHKYDLVVDERYDVWKKTLETLRELEGECK